jgi:hypothetical protein
MRNCTLAFTLMSLLAGNAVADALPPIANGTVALPMATFQIVDGIAFPEGDHVWIALAAAPIDRAVMRKDGRLDAMDIDRQKMHTLVLDLGPEGTGICVGVNVYDGELSSDSVCDEAFATAMGVQHIDGRVVGAATWKGDDGRQLELMFNLPVEK